MQCLNPKCQEENGSVELEITDDDDRQEWRAEAYWCPKCHTIHEHRTTFQPQSRLVAKDEFYIVEYGAGYEQEEPEPKEEGEYAEAEGILSDWDYHSLPDGEKVIWAIGKALEALRLAHRILATPGFLRRFLSLSIPS